jgi:hypothetical protein
MHSCIRFADVQHPTAATRLASKFCTQKLFFFYSSVTSNLTIHDGLELEFDKMMTSFGAAALPRHRLRSLTLHSFSSTARLLTYLLACLLACLPLLGVVEMTRHCSNLQGLRPFTRLFAHADFIPTRMQFLDGGRLLATLSRRIQHDHRNFLIRASLPTFTATPLALGSI